MRAVEREIRKMVAECGLTLRSMEKCGSGHFKIVVACEQKTALVVFPSTPSDQRGMLNKRAQLRRFACGREGRVG